MKKALSFVLAFLARKIISKYEPKIIGVTGSFGKSSVKETIFHVLHTNGKKVRRSRGSLNNEFGLPLAVIDDFSHAGGAVFYLSAIIKGLIVWLFKSEYPQILVLEYGADKPNDIKYLASIIYPDIAVITGISNVPAHVEFYPSPEAVADDAFDLVKSLTKKGIIILNADDELTIKMADKTDNQVLLYGFSPQSDFTISQFSHRFAGNTPLGIAFHLKTTQESTPVIIDGVLGKGAAYSAAAAFACASVLKINLNQTAKSMTSIKTIAGRARIIEGINDSWLIDDTYNSSPSAASEALVALKSSPAKRKIAVLGGMMELGEYSDEAHDKLGREAVKSADLIIGIGERGKRIISVVAENEKETMWFASSVVAAPEIKKLVRQGDLILVKGSQSVRTEHIVKALMKNPNKASSLLVRQYGNWLKK